MRENYPIGKAIFQLNNSHRKKWLLLEGSALNNCKLLFQIIFLNWLLLICDSADGIKPFRRPAPNMPDVLDVPSCDACGHDAILHQIYSGRTLCGEHLAKSVRKRVSKSLRKQLELPRQKKEDEKTTILVAISGGKDSAVLLSFIHHLLHKRRDVVIVAGVVDEGIDGYRSPSMDCAQELCDELGVKLERVSYSELGFEEMDVVVEHLPNIQSRNPVAKGMAPCSFCGVFRRQGIIHLAKRVNASVVALGHNLDDMAQSVLMNMQKADLDRTLRLAPHTSTPLAGMTPRIVPLRWVPEREIHAYAMYKNLPFFHGDCPYAKGALRQRHRDFVASMEEDVPGSMHGLLHSADRIKELYAQIPNENVTDISPIRECIRCGSITSADVCKACEMMDWVRDSTNPQ